MAATEIVEVEQTQGEVIPAEDFKYDPQKMLGRTAEVQNRVIDSIMQLDMDKVAHSPSHLEAIGSFLNGVNNTAVQTTRNNIVQSAMDVGAIADAVYDKMRKEKHSGIRTVGDESAKGRKGTIPKNVDITLDADQKIEEGMLERGLVSQTYDEFAEIHQIGRDKDE